MLLDPLNNKFSEPDPFFPDESSDGLAGIKWIEPLLTHSFFPATVKESLVPGS
jgi:hypothetical protein